MGINQLILISPLLITFIYCHLEPKIIDGQDADIRKFPHSAYLFIKCFNGNVTLVYMCGASILNQYLTLTAAHCTNNCTKQTYISAYVGNEIWYYGATSTAHSFLEHENYNGLIPVNDICLVRLNTPLTFSENIARIALMENPPNDTKALVAGWGFYNESQRLGSETLQYAVLRVKRGKDCPHRKLEDLDGVFCGRPLRGRPFKGDSGSALFIRRYIQIGLVSYGISVKKFRLLYFTDVGYHYKWIMNNTNVILNNCEATNGTALDNEESCVIGQ